MKKMYMLPVLALLSMGCSQRPSMVQNAFTVTGDGEIRLYWDPNTESDIDFYRIYRSYTQSGFYELIAETPFECFIDYAVSNGVTYFYAVSAVNGYGEEGPLTNYLIYDTPRPEGYYASILDIYLDPSLAGWDFSSYSVCDAQSVVCDIYYEVYNGQGYIVCADLNTDIQDMGWVRCFDEISYAPTQGWSPTGDAVAIPNHVYIIWTRTDNYAKIFVRETNGDEIVFDWAYQLEPGNRELGINPDVYTSRETK
ncbi:hypothetical protein JXA84_02765 [candidate division WOR-3 bacterium]|nr:hypothetical protein [candidate division WOR-3 bacterium]